jgi:hypothetical protein
LALTISSVPYSRLTKAMPLKTQRSFARSSCAAEKNRLASRRPRVGRRAGSRRGRTGQDRRGSRTKIVATCRVFDAAGNISSASRGVLHECIARQKGSRRTGAAFRPHPVGFQSGGRRNGAEKTDG